eukprot:GHVN01106365.1.p1 GENE.GHVN01106365.1~~GHVN01106365.1.p1  ORF type:complete len:198 (+),score=20.04 GHVN01106365.1:369-962(+)
MRGRDMAILMTLALPAVMGVGYGYEPEPTCDSFYFTREVTTQDPTWAVYVRPKQEGYGHNDYRYETLAVEGDILGTYRIELTHPTHFHNVVFANFGKAGDFTMTAASGDSSVLLGQWKKIGCNAFVVNAHSASYADAKPYQVIATNELKSYLTFHYDGSFTSKGVSSKRDLYGKVISGFEGETRGEKVPEVRKEVKY